MCKEITFVSYLVISCDSFYAPGLNDGGHIVFILSVCLLSTLTFPITFEPLEIETSYLTCILKDALSNNTEVNHYDIDYDLCV